ncbi:MAG TPA: glycerol-3-phosphate acyltransferase [Gemmatimonadaceae bacterium]|nr:glycerol-3-phosphate acyltransferase [Gemmatimonadaceae bacterium]
MTRVLSVVVISYALGCISGAYYILRLSRGRDIRASGSGNAGARNMLRVAGRGPALGTFLFDAAKGTIAVALAQAVLPREWAGGVAMLCVVVGHVWPAQLSFRGGKGVSTALGALLLVDPLTVLYAAAAGAVTGLLARSSTVGGLAAVAFSAPAAIFAGLSAVSVALVAATTLLILWAHHPSFERLRPPPPLVGAERGLS